MAKEARMRKVTIMKAFLINLRFSRPSPRMKRDLVIAFAKVIRTFDGEE